PYRDRRRYLAQCLLPSRHLQLVHSSGNAEQLYAASIAHGFEGILAKRLDSRYEAGRRSRAWLKIKDAKTGEFLIGGYTRGKGARDPGAAAPAAGGKDPDDGDAEAAAAEAVLEQLKDPANRLDLTVGDARVRLTNLDRVYWPAGPGKDQPAVTKRDFLRYLARVA